MAETFQQKKLITHLQFMSHDTNKVLHNLALNNYGLKTGVSNMWLARRTFCVAHNVFWEFLYDQDLNCLIY